MQGHTLTLLHRLHHGRRVVHLHADHPDLGAHGLDVVGHASNQPAAANGDKHGIERALVLAQQLHGDGALAGNHLGVVKRVNKGQPLRLLQRERMLVGVRITVAPQHHLAPQGLDRLDLHGGCGDGHDDHRAAPQFVSAQGHPLRMIAR